MLKADNGKDLISEIRLSEPKRIIPPNKFVNKSKDKRPYYGLV